MKYALAIALSHEAELLLFSFGSLAFFRFYFRLVEQAGRGIFIIGGSLIVASVSLSGSIWLSIKWCHAPDV